MSRIPAFSSNYKINKLVIDLNPILYFWPNPNRNQNAVTETESNTKNEPKVLEDLK